MVSKSLIGSTARIAYNVERLCVSAVIELLMLTTKDELYYNPEKVIIFLSFIEGAEYLKENLTNLLII